MARIGNWIPGLTLAVAGGALLAFAGSVSAQVVKIAQPHHPGEVVQPAQRLEPLPESSGFDRPDSVRCLPEAEIGRWDRPLSAIRISSRPPGKELPTDCDFQVIGEEPLEIIRPPRKDVRWVPAEYVHQPLYFEDIPLERYGQTIIPGTQPIASATRFFFTFPFMPFKLAYQHPYRHVHSYGHWTPGSPAPGWKQLPRLPADHLGDFWARLRDKPNDNRPNGVKRLYVNAPESLFIVPERRWCHPR